MPDFHCVPTKVILFAGRRSGKNYLWNLIYDYLKLQGKNIGEIHESYSEIKQRKAHLNMDSNPSFCFHASPTDVLGRHFDVLFLNELGTLCKDEWYKYTHSAKQLFHFTSFFDRNDKRLQLQNKDKLSNKETWNLLKSRNDVLAFRLPSWIINPTLCPKQLTEIKKENPNFNVEFGAEFD